MTYPLESKRAGEVRFYRHDWSAFLGDDTIATSSWAVNGVTKDSEANDTTTATVWVSAGTAGTIATLTNTITTAGGLTEFEDFTLAITAFDEPLNLTEAKAHLRVTDTSEDALIESYIVAAREWVENYTGHVLVQRVVEDAFHEWGDFLTLRHQPVTVDDPTPTLTVNYIDTDGDEIEYEERVIRDQRYPWTIWAASGAEFPTLGTNGTITVTYTAGYANPALVPQPLKQAMLLLIGQWHQQRGAASADEMFEVPFAVTSLCRKYRGAVMA